MRYRYVHLDINPVGAIAGALWATLPPGHPELLEKYLSTVSNNDWYRYGAQNYVVWTAMELSELATQIAHLPGYANVYVLLTEVANPGPMGSNGWMPVQFWNWLNKPR